MSKHFEELCTLLVDEALGNLPSRLFSILFKHGRQPLPILTQRCTLPSRYVKSGLAILVQHRLVSYHTSEEDNVTYYEADARNAYDLLRSGKNVQLLQHTLGVGHGGLAQKFCFGGLISASEIASLDTDSVHDTPAHYTNGVTNGHKLANGVDGPHHRETSLALESKQQDSDPRENLFIRGYAVGARELDYMSSHDFTQIITDDIKTSKYGGEVKAKDRLQFENDVNKQIKRSLGSNRVNEVEVGSLFSKEKSKRPHEDMEQCTKRHPQQRTDSSRPQKQRKLNRGQGYDPGSEEMLDMELQDANPSLRIHESSREKVGVDKEATDDRVFRLNREKLEVARRNEKLVTLSALCLGETPARVYKALLQCAEHKLRQCFDVHGSSDRASEANHGEVPEHPSASVSVDVCPAISSKDILAQLDSHMDLSGLFETSDQSKSAKPQIRDGTQPVAVKHKKNGYRTTTDDLEGANDEVGNVIRLEQVKRVLRLLEDHPIQFVNRTTADQDAKWRVNFPALSRTLIQREIEAYVQSRFGPVASRIVRFLQAKGRIEEKTIAGLLLLAHREVRYHCDAMHQAGILDIQEVPRDNARNLKTAFWLWFYDQDRTRRDLLHDVYKTMSRLLQRLKVERAQVQSVLEKAERSDVKGHEDEYLSKAERVALDAWNMKEEKILVELSRLDDTVAVLRDFLPSNVE